MPTVTRILSDSNTVSGDVRFHDFSPTQIDEIMAHLNDMLNTDQGVENEQ